MNLLIELDYRIRHWVVPDDKILAWPYRVRQTFSSYAPGQPSRSRIDMRKLIVYTKKIAGVGVFVLTSARNRVHSF